MHPEGEDENNDYLKMSESDDDDSGGNNDGDDAPLMAVDAAPGNDSNDGDSANTPTKVLGADTQSNVGAVGKATDDVATTQKTLQVDVSSLNDASDAINLQLLSVLRSMRVLADKALKLEEDTVVKGAGKHLGKKGDFGASSSLRQARLKLKRLSMNKVPRTILFPGNSF